MLGLLCERFEENVKIMDDTEDDEIGILEDMRYLKRVCRELNKEGSEG